MMRSYGDTNCCGGCIGCIGLGATADEKVDQRIIKDEGE